MVRLVDGVLGWHVERVQATVRLAAGSVNLVRLGSGDAGRLGGACSGCGVLSSAMVRSAHRLTSKLVHGK